METGRRKWSNAVLLWGALGVMAVLPSQLFAAEASRCTGNGVANGASLQQKVRNGVCGNDRPVAQVPEPSSLALMAVGLVAVGVRQFRKSKNSQ